MRTKRSRRARARAALIRCAALACLLAPAAALGQTPEREIDLLKLERTRRIPISRLSGPVTFDGLSDEAAWSGATRFPFIQQGPQFGLPPSERTEAFAGYDDDYLYFAGRLYDREPDKIQAPTKKRDAMVANTEWFGILLDTFNDKENGLIFFTAPSGLRLDMTVFNDAVSQSSDMNAMPVNIDATDAQHLNEWAMVGSGVPPLGIGGLSAPTPELIMSMKFLWHDWEFLKGSQLAAVLLA